MRRCLLSIYFLSGCAEPRLAPQALPELSTAAPAPLEARELLFAAGERMSWDVRLRGVSVGTAELAVGGDEVAAPSELVITSRFRTNQLASSVLAVEHRLITVVRGAEPASAVDELRYGGTHRRVETTFAAGHYQVDQVSQRTPPGVAAVHTLHSALGWLRGWADADAEAGHIHILHRRRLYRLEVGRPLREAAPGRTAAALRVDCQALPADSKGDGILLTVWLSDDGERAPLRVDAAVDGTRVLAELIDHQRP